MNEFHLSSISTIFLYKTLVLIVPKLGKLIPPKYPLNLLNMNNTSLLRITATAGT